MLIHSFLKVQYPDITFGINSSEEKKEKRKKYMYSFCNHFQIFILLFHHPAIHMHFPLHRITEL